MIFRVVLLLVSGGVAYALLKGWPEGLPILLRACLAVPLLLGGLVFLATGGVKSGDKVPVAKGGRKPRWVDFLAIGMAMLALECGFLWLLSVAPEPLERVAMSLEYRISPQAGDDEQVVEAGEDGGGNWLWDDEQSRPLPRRTNLKPGAKPEVFLKVGNEKDAARLLKRQLHVRAFVMTDYEDGVWSAGQTDERDLVADDGGWIRMGEETEGEILHEVFHPRDMNGRNVLTGLQGTRAVRLPELKVIKEGLVLLPEVESGKTGYNYLVSSMPVSLKDLEGEVVESAGVGQRRGGRLGRLAEKAAGEGELLVKLMNVRDFLRDNYGYSLVTENRKDLDPLENFLYEERRGHCEFFATAGALMVRELGVESRVAYGWAGGQFFPSDGMFVFRAREAHAWVEVNLKGYGWVAMEPTPPVVLAGGGAPRVAAAGEEMPGDEELLEDEEVAYSAGRKWVWPLFGLTLLFAVAAMGVFLFRRRMIDFSREAGGAPVVRQGDYFSVWKRLFGRRTGETLKMELAGQGEELEFSEELVSYHYGVRYEGKARDKVVEADLVRRISKGEIEEKR
ncbi:MAG: transglutaminase-like domain-containing protein [Luteolibacter sp.]